MSDDFPKRGFTFQLSLNAAHACIGALTAALHIATELAVFAERIEVDDVSRLARLEDANEQIIRHVKSLFTEGFSERDEADGITVALGLIADNFAAIRRRIQSQ